MSKRNFNTQQVYSVAVTLLLVVTALLAAWLWFNKGSITETQAKNIALGSALKYCLDHGNGEQVCKQIVLKSIDRVNYGPTDGRDEYYGSWIVVFFSNYPGSKVAIQVSLDSQGKVEYTNTGEPEYPNAK